MTIVDSAKTIPTKIIGYWLEDDDFLTDFALLSSWSPFEAACLINNVKPGPIVNGVAKVGRILNIDLSTYDVPDPQEGLNWNKLINFTKIIVRNFDKQLPINATAVIQWAVDQALLDSRSYLASRILSPRFSIDRNQDITRQLAEAIKRAEAAESLIAKLQAELDRKHKATGQHHAEKRFKILSAILAEVCMNTQWAPYLVNGRLVAERFAQHLDQHRDAHDLPSAEAHGYSFNNITDTILAAQKAVIKKDS